MCLHPAFMLVSCSVLFSTWRWRRYVPPKQWLTFSGLHDISQKTELFITTGVRTSNPTRDSSVYCELRHSNNVWAFLRGFRLLLVKYILKISTEIFTFPIFSYDSHIKYFNWITYIYALQPSRGNQKSRFVLVEIESEIQAEAFYCWHLMDLLATTTSDPYSPIKHITWYARHDTSFDADALMRYTKPCVHVVT
jgi:hypothetical protein